jgi:hypothetical protein
MPSVTVLSSPSATEHHTDSCSSPGGIRNRRVSATWMKSSKTNRRGRSGSAGRCFCMSTTDGLSPDMAA